MRVAELTCDSYILTDGQRIQLQAVIDKFPSFAVSVLGKTSLLLYEEVDRTLKLGVIEESDSPWSSPVVLVQKPGKVRLCLDSRKVNERTRENAYPLPQIDGILSRLSKANKISSLDLKDAYWQMPLEPQSRDKTALTIPGKPLYQYKVMPFGLTNASQTMSRLMDKVIFVEPSNEVLVHLDDLLIVSDSFDSHSKVFSSIASCIRAAGLTLNVEKSNFGMKSVKYLGHIVG